MGKKALGRVSSLLRKEDVSLLQRDVALVSNHCLDCKFKMLSHSLCCLSDLLPLGGWWSLYTESLELLCTALPRESSLKVMFMPL